MHIFPSLNFQAGYCSKSSFCAVCYISAQTKSFRQNDLKLLLQEPNTNRDTEKKFQVVPTTRAAAIKENRAASFTVSAGTVQSSNFQKTLENLKI